MVLDEIKGTDRTVLVAMSGGVDSSVAAALLKQRGFKVVGITMKIWECGEQWRGCCGISGVDDARRVAQRLGIPHYVLDLRDAFEELIIKPFCDAYLEGKTPNPCILCNRWLKFGELLRKADQLGIRYVATGHYARIQYDRVHQAYLLKKGADRAKDQSYFLYVLGQGQLRRTLFPVGDLTKSRVRKLAKHLGLHVAHKPGSQEICFVTDGNYRDFVIKRTGVTQKPGPILGKDGNVLGQHNGIVSYTIGQRRRIGISAGKPLYVVAIDKERNAVIVGQREDIFCSEFIGEQAAFVCGIPPTEVVRARVRMRYRQPTVWATIVPESAVRVRVVLDEPKWGIAPGQAAVFYRGDTVLGGATIDSTVKVGIE